MIHRSPATLVLMGFVLMGLALGSHNHALQAQQVIEVPGQDRQLDAAEGLVAFIELDELDVATVVVRKLPATLR